MDKNDFLNAIKSDERIKLNDFAVQKLAIFLRKIDHQKPEDNGLLQVFLVKLSTYQKSRIYSNDFYRLLFECVQEQADFEAKNHKIKDFTKTRYEEEELLKNFFIQSRLNALGLSFIQTLGLHYA
ncbi:hypothetical protein LS68_009320 [Helicobacter sp. MIT 05-5293]|uniref:hypothetical protein n=1 Tax=unclassified Helicobacter TaxID=2593540 RepID=UPI00051DCC50|nr:MULTISPECIES: hypothetical protein [unclassified Helicobacter]TLD79859.1 hypothetical protein LS68_009320 [Helicobacter sp. MIT 05-5293]TLD85532.1 hypothetical protein LS69_009070 [Helicobacter sp. MIT 05-5294]